LSSGPLEGIRILDLTRLLPGGYATLLLADLGADVVKVEEPGKGDYIRWTPPIVGDFSAAHIALNRNKRSLTLNLKTDSGRAAFLRLVESFDVVIESFRPGVMARLGLGWHELRERSERLVYCAISGYGQDGPYSLMAGHDANYIGYAGVLSIIGEEGRRPVLPGVQVGDLAGGGMAAVAAILAALVRRANTGTGDFCDISMTDGAVSWLSIHAAEFVATKQEPQRELMHLSGLYPCYRVYPAADGWITVGALEPHFWAELCEAVDRPDLAGDAFATGLRRSEVVSELEQLFSTKTRAAWMDHFADRDVCVAPVKSVAESFDDPQVRARGMVFESEVEGVGEWTHIGNPLKIGEARTATLRRQPPQLGEHTDEVLAGAGFSATEIDDLRAAGSI
jgi:alpha-methylacyl-CoA racemase